jgi:hypothetical protein
LIWRWEAKLVARLLFTAALGLNPDISQKYKKGDLCMQKSGQHTLARQAKLGRWVAKLGRWTTKLGRWAAKLIGRWVAKLWRACFLRKLWV